MGDTKDHPAWEVYNLYRDCRLNVRYWTKKLAVLQRCNFWIEYSLLFTAPGSAIAGFVFWQTSNGKAVWMVLTALTTALGIAKPLLQLSRKVETLQKTVLGYRSVESQVQELCNDIRREDRYSAELVQAFKILEKQYQKVRNEEPVEDLDETLRQSCFEAVNRELPEASFHVPSTRIDPPSPWKTR